MPPQTGYTHSVNKHIGEPAVPLLVHLKKKHFSLRYSGPFRRAQLNPCRRSFSFSCSIPANALVNIAQLHPTTSPAPIGDPIVCVGAMIVCYPVLMVSHRLVPRDDKDDELARALAALSLLSNVDAVGTKSSSFQSSFVTASCVRTQTKARTVPSPSCERTRQYEYSSLRKQVLADLLDVQLPLASSFVRVSNRSTPAALDFGEHPAPNDEIFWDYGRDVSPTPPSPPQPPTSSPRRHHTQTPAQRLLFDGQEGMVCLCA